jgi:hypothetical protein
VSASIFQLRPRCTTFSHMPTVFYTLHSIDRISLRPEKRFLAAKVGLQRDLRLQSDDRKQSSRDSFLLKVALLPILSIIALLAVLRLPNLARLQINAAPDRISRAIALAVGLR